MPDSADYRRPRRGNPRFDDDEPGFAKRARHRPSLPRPDDYDPYDPIATGLLAGDRWSTWDQTEMLISND